MYHLENYPELKRNFFLEGRDIGASRKLSGKVALLTVFLKRDPEDWSEKRKNGFFNAINNSEDFLKREAQRYGASLELSGYYFEVDVPADANPMRGFDLIKDYFSYPDMESLQRAYEEMLHVDEAAFLLLFDSGGRSFAVKQDKCDRYASQELSVIFFVRSDEEELSFAITHELLHQFGAVDFYFPKQVRQTAEKYLPDSVMCSRCNTVDDLTAYLVGWKNTVSSDALWFLRDTMWITPKVYSDLLSEEWKK